MITEITMSTTLKRQSHARVRKRRLSALAYVWTMTPAGEWEPDAENWVRWARTPQHDAYWYYRDSFFDQLVPPPGRRSIEIGCGEGRVARDLSARGHYVAGIDSSHTLLVYAHQEDRNSSYALAEGAGLPFRDVCFDLAVAYNSLQVVADMPGTVREAARVLCPGGRFCVCVSHPVADVGRFVDNTANAAFVVREDYFAHQRVDDKVARDGLEMTFRGWTYSLEDYATALERAGLMIDTIREPRPAGAPPKYGRWNRIPMFLLLRATKA
jgi:SAM-dependent methyltransferase